MIIIQAGDDESLDEGVAVDVVISEMEKMTGEVSFFFGGGVVEPHVIFRHMKFGSQFVVEPGVQGRKIDRRYKCCSIDIENSKIE